MIPSMMPKMCMINAPAPRVTHPPRRVMSSIMIPAVLYPRMNLWIPNEPMRMAHRPAASFLEAASEWGLCGGYCGYGFGGIWLIGCSHEWAAALLVVLDHLLQVIAHRRDGLAGELHRAVDGPLDDRVMAGEGVLLVGEVLAEVAAAGFTPIKGAAGDGLGDAHEVGEIKASMPARVILAVAVDADLGRAGLEARETVEGRGHVLLVADDADLVLHHVLEIVLNAEGIFAPLTIERRESFFGRGFDLLVIKLA